MRCWIGWGSRYELDVIRSPALLSEAMPRATANSIRPFFFFARAFSR